jgi:hypothetical protein
MRPVLNKETLYYRHRDTCLAIPQRAKLPLPLAAARLLELIERTLVTIRPSVRWLAVESLSSLPMIVRP